MQISGETIAEVDASALRVDGRAEPRLRLTMVSDVQVILAVQADWNALGEVGAFHWPAVFNRNPISKTSVVHDGPSSHSVLVLLQCQFDAHTPCDRDLRQDVTYVSFIEVAPAHRDRRRSSFRGLGSFTVAVASEFARQAQPQGAVGLHSLDTAAHFYRKLGFVDVDCLNEYKEVYLELTAVPARRLRSRYGAST